MGIDKIAGPKPVLVSVQIINPVMSMNKGSSSDNPVIIASAKGKTVYDAIHAFAKIIPRQLFFAHTNIIVFGDAAARQGLQDVHDLLQRNPQFRRSSWVVVTPQMAKDLLESTLDLQKYSAIGMREMMQHDNQGAPLKKAQRKDFMSDLTGISASAVGITMKLKQSEGDKEKKKVEVGGSAIFHKDKLVGYLEDDDNRGLLWITDEMKDGNVSVKCSAGDEGIVSFRIAKTRSKLQPEDISDQLKMNIEIDADAMVAENPCVDVDLSKPDTLHELERELADQIASEITATVRKTQSMQSDIFGFGDAFRRRNPNAFQQFSGGWDKHYAAMKVSVHANVQIKLMGMTSETLNLR
jgi:spore germination protein KC